MEQKILSEIFSKGGYFRVIIRNERQHDAWLDIGGRVALMSYNPKDSDSIFILEKLYESIKQN